MAEATNPERANRILDAASKLIAHYGYDKTSVSDIAHAAGVSKGAIYLHWSSKADLFEALIFRESMVVLDDLVQRVEADPDGGTLFSLYRHSLLAMLDNELTRAIFARDMRVMGDFIRRWKETGLADRGELFRHELVRGLQATGVIRADLDADAVAFILTVIRYGFVKVHEIVSAERTPPLEQVGDVLATMLERALSPADGGNREAGKQVIGQIVERIKAMLEEYRQTQKVRLPD
jgi:TetR/AcrR family acrAB operon transcriptional repressor